MPTDVAVLDATGETADELKAAAHERIAEGHAMLARALRMRASPAADPLVSVESVAAELGIRPRVITDAAARGELEIGHAGRKPIVRRSEVERWAASRRTAPKTDDQLSPREAARAAAAARAARRAS